MAYRRMLTNPAALGEMIELNLHQLRLSNLRPDELCLVVTDTAFNPAYAQAACAAARALGAQVYQITLPHSASLPTKSFRSAVRETDLLVYSSTHKLHYSEEVREGLAVGMRALMSVQPLHAMARLKADPEVARRAKLGSARLACANRIRITSQAGTDLSMERGSRPALATYGLADEPGHLDFFACGMVQTAPLEGSLEGTLVLDRGDQMFYMSRYVSDPVTITFREGRITEIEGGMDAWMLRKALESYGDENAWRAGHIAWGVDRRANWMAHAFQYSEPGVSGADIESYYGNVQVELGSNNDVAFQGRIDSEAHLGHCMLNCSLYLDDELVIEGGEFVDEALR